MPRTFALISMTLAMGCVEPPSSVDGGSLDAGGDASAVDGGARLARGRVFASSPDDGPPVDRALPGLAAGSRTLSGDVFRVYSCISDACLEALECDAPGPCTEGLVAQLAVADDAGDFLYEPRLDPRAGPDPAAEVSAYFHLARFAAVYAALGAREPPRPVWVIVGVPEALGVPAGATAIWGSDGLLIGEVGDRNVAYDPDVFGHELAHVLFPAPDPTLRPEGLSIAIGALVEGTADYFACSIADDPSVGEYTAEALGAPYLSSVANDARCPGDLLGESHVDGQILSGALWDLRTELGSAVVDPVVVHMLRDLARGASFDDVSAQIVEDLEASSRPRARQILMDRGVMGCGSVVDVPLGGARLIQLYPVGLEVYDPAQGEVDVLAPMPGGLQARVAIPMGAGPIQIEVAIDDGEIGLEDVTIHARLDAPVSFDRAGLTLQTTADTEAPATAPWRLDQLAGVAVEGHSLHLALTSGAVDFATVRIAARRAP